MALRLLYSENLRFYMRTRRFQIIVPLFALLSAIEPILIVAGIISKPADVYAYTQSALMGFSDYVLLVCALLAGDAISRDFSREGYFTLTQPVRRSEIMFARFLSAFTVALIALLVVLSVGVGLGEYLYSKIIPQMAEIVTITILYTAALTAFVIMFSSFSKSSAVSIVIALVVVLLAMPIVQSIVEFLTKVEPWFLITYASEVISNLANKTYPPHLVTEKIGSHTLYIYSPSVVEGVAIMFGYLLLSVMITWAIYSRRELK